MSRDKNKQQRFCVGVSLEKAKGGKLRLVLNDLQSADGESGWKERCLFTFLDVDEKSARNYSLDSASYASVGDAVLARLLALEDDP